MRFEPVVLVLTFERMTSPLMRPQPEIAHLGSLS